jgi:hypothetical protein
MPAHTMLGFHMHNAPSLHISCIRVQINMLHVQNLQDTARAVLSVAEDWQLDPYSAEQPC